MMLEQDETPTAPLEENGTDIPAPEPGEEQADETPKTETVPEVDEGEPDEEEEEPKA